MIKDSLNNILKEIKQVLEKVDEKSVSDMILDILAAKKIVCVGAGRVGMATRGFAMRLGHFGLNAFMLGDATVPSIGKGDLLVVASGSGETKTILDIVKIAHENGAKISLVTGNPESSMGKLANTVVQIQAPSKTKPINNFKSIQPMTTLNEQCLGIFFDGVVLEMMRVMGEDHDSMWARHSNLE
ncbi:MAG: 6-phospho 3-hexuloisomerase [Berkelbacteria bacterium GW2011_GWA2_35_9]|uniref:6-phospho 3-hexuloisomerase n=1 Tax=Berkelbacteria bacterium GW2011_GWA2_35_9 TaxID=1618333 RepID=A0A0G0D2Z1_9BACT|nr:MAG: 6-phospho 3-hexuloisomerase [Berkelbacteria bacterium GW2011_GWA2_35_9]